MCRWALITGIVGMLVFGTTHAVAQQQFGQQAQPQAKDASDAASQGSGSDTSTPDKRLNRASSVDRRTDKLASHDDSHDQPTRFFLDDFRTPTIERRNWEIARGATPTRDLYDQGHAVAGVCLACGARGDDDASELRSVAIPLAAVPGAELSYTVRHRGVEAGERLLVEFLDKDGDWRPIERVVADGRDSIGFSRRMHALPEEALHAAFRVRFRASADDTDDAWYLGEVSIVGYEPRHTLAVRVRPPQSARIEVVPSPEGERLDGTAPFTRSLRFGTCVHLVAPPTAAGWVFSHWTLDGEVRPDRRRLTTLDVSKDVEAVAHYKPWVQGREPASVAIVSVPETGTRVLLGPDAERFYTEIVADSEYRCLTGDWLTLLAPPQCGKLGFARWVVNGVEAVARDNLLELRVGGDDLLLAEYVLLGDMNGDGELDKFDVDEFVAALVDPEAYAAQYPDLDRVLRGDVNGDGVFDALDVESFVDLLLQE